MKKLNKRKLYNMILDLIKSRCINVTKLISEDMDLPKSASRWLAIGFHLALCEYCREYKTQLETLRKLTLDLENKAPELKSQGSMKLESKEKLNELIKKNYGEDILDQ